MEKIAVIHPFQQHSYKTAVAVKKNGYKLYYLTSTYNKKGSITRKTLKYLKGSTLDAAKNRCDSRINDNEVIQIGELYNLIILLIRRLKMKKLYNYLERKMIKFFNMKVYKFLVKNNINKIIVYDKYSYDLIKKIREKNKNITIFLDMSAPLQTFVLEECIEAEIEKYSKIIPNGIIQKIYKFYDNDILEKYTYEVKNSDICLVASTFSKKSIEKIKSDNEIYICQYDIEKTTSILKKKILNKSLLKCIIVGRVSLEKGFFTLLETIKKLEVNKFCFDFFGEDLINVNQFHLPSNCTFHGQVNKNQLMKYLEEFDVIISASLYDGYGFSVIEGMSKGLVPVISSNVGCRDILEDKENCYVFSTHSSSELENILNYLFLNRKSVTAIRKNNFNMLSNYKNIYSYQLGKALKYDKN